MKEKKKKTPKQVRKAWVSALKSGKYKQGNGTLRSDDNKFCCLGVLCDLAVKEGVIPEPIGPKNSGQFKKYIYEGYNASVLPERVREWAGLRKASGAFNSTFYGRDGLTSINDGTKAGFKRIAKLIESEPEGLFEEE